MSSRANGALTRAYLHAKPFLIDGETFSSGSANATHNGRERSFDISARIEHSATRREFAQLFEALWYIVLPLGRPGLSKGR